MERTLEGIRDEFNKRIDQGLAEKIVSTSKQASLQIRALVNCFIKVMNKKCPSELEDAAQAALWQIEEIPFLFQQIEYPNPITAECSENLAAIRERSPNTSHLVQRRIETFWRFPDRFKNITSEWTDAAEKLIDLLTEHNIRSYSDSNELSSDLGEQYQAQCGALLSICNELNSLANSLDGMSHIYGPDASADIFE